MANARLREIGKTIAIVLAGMTAALMLTVCFPGEERGLAGNYQRLAAAAASLGLFVAARSLLRSSVGAVRFRLLRKAAAILLAWMISLLMLIVCFPSWNLGWESSVLRVVAAGVAVGLFIAARISLRWSAAREESRRERIIHRCVLFVVSMLLVVVMAGLFHPSAFTSLEITGALAVAVAYAGAVSLQLADEWMKSRIAAARSSLVECLTSWWRGLRQRLRGYRNWQILRGMAHLARAVLLVVTLLAAVTAGLWCYFPSVIDEFDSSIASRYLSSYETQLAAAERIGNDTDQADALESLVQSLSAIRRDDRLHPLKRRAIGRLIRSLEESGQTERALAWCDEFVAQDERDLRAQLLRASLLFRDPQRSAEGARLLRQLFDKVPEAQFIAREYSRLLADRGSNTDAFLVIDEFLKHQDHKLTSKWHFFWDSGSGTNLAQSHSVRPFLEDSTRWRWSLTLEPGVRQLWIVPPNEAAVRVQQAELWVWDGQRETRQSIADAGDELSPLLLKEADGEEIETAPPKFSWIVPEELRGRPLTVSLVGDVEPVFQPWLVDLCTLFRSHADAIESDLKARNDDDGVRRFRLLLSHSLASKPPTLSRRQDGNEVRVDRVDQASVAEVAR
jgi:hypothetical protein